MGHTRRVRATIGLGVLSLVPLLLTTSAPLPSAHDQGDDGTIYYALASSSGERAAMLDEVGAGTFLAEGSPARENGEVAVSSPKGTRVWTVSALSDHGLPKAAEKAYRAAAAQMAQSDPGCQLPWTLLAGIGRVESDHGRYGGSRLGADGVSQPRIIGVQLNGAGPVAAIRDTDDGRLDRDEVWDRAVGPMQFIPSTWASAARDGDGDGRRSPHDLDDAAAAAASYLCSGSGSLRDPGTQAAAIFRYNQDDYYVALVQAFEVGYRTGVFVIPSPPVEEAEVEEGDRKKRKRTAAARAGTSDGVSKKSTTQSTSKPKPADTSPTKTSPKPAPKPSPTPTPSPTPAPPEPTTVTATLTESGGAYFLGGKLLDLGIVGQTAATAVGDFDQDGAVETNGDELAGMLGKQVTMVVVPLDGKLGIYSINGISLG